LDVGCGDLQFWDRRDCPDYLGIDSSQYIQQENAKRRPQWKFEVLDATKETIRFQKATVFCFDLLFHVLPEEGFRFLLENLAAATSEWLFVTNWSRNPLPNGVTTDGVYQVYRDLRSHLADLKPLALAGVHQLRGSPKAFYAFRRG
jgi:hypothetical protein